MTSYITITDAETDPEAPLTSELAKKWRDNPIAIAEGAAGAPRIAVGALQRLNPGDQVRSRQDGEVVSPSAGTVSKEMFAFMQAGTVRITFDHKNDGSGGGTVSVNRTRNGSNTVVASFSNTTTYQTRSVDVTVLPGDSIRISNYAGSLTSQYARLRNCRVQTNGEDLYPGSSAFLEGNTYA